MTELRFELVPMEGALPLRLDQTAAEVAQVMSSLGLQPSSDRGQSVYYLENSIQIEFGEATGRSQFIGFANQAGLEVIYGGEKVNGRSAEEVAALFGKREDVPPPFDDLEMLFRQQILTLWDADPQYNLTQSNVPIWGQIGIGSPQYLAAIDALKG